MPSFVDGIGAPFINPEMLDLARRLLDSAIVVTQQEAAAAIRVAVFTPGVSDTTITFPQGGEVRSALQGKQAPGFPVRVGKGGRVRILWNGAYRVVPLVSGQSTAKATVYEDDPCVLGVLCPTTTTAP